ncbi:hypothetical protein QYF61_025776, partial [Mycteria americana]
MSRDIFNQIRLLRAPSNLTLNVSRDGASATSLGNLFQCLTTLMAATWYPQRLLFSRLNNPNSQLFLIGEVLHPPDHFCGPPLDLLQQVHVFPVLRAPELDAVLQVPQVVMNLIFSYRGRNFAFTVPALRSIHWRGVGGKAASEDSVKKVVEYLSLLLIQCYQLASRVHQGKPFLLFFASLAKFSSSCALAFLTPSLHNRAASLYFSQDTCPCFHCLCISFLPFSLTSSLLPFLPDYLHLRIESSCALWKASFKICQLCSAPLSLRAVSQGSPDFTLHLSHIPQDCELHQCMITAAQAASNLDITNQLTCVDDQQVQYRIPSACDLPWPKHPAAPKRALQRAECDAGGRVCQASPHGNPSAAESRQLFLPTFYMVNHLTPNTLGNTQELELFILKHREEPYVVATHVFLQIGVQMPRSRYPSRAHCSPA